MSNTKPDYSKYTLPIDLPKCECFNTEEGITTSRCADVADLSRLVCGIFHELMNEKNLCKAAMPYAMDMAVISMLALAARTEGPALEYGSEEIERESMRIFAAMVESVPKRAADIYARGRAMGITEETIKAMTEASKKGRLQ